MLEKLGHLTIEGKLGEGGMGLVYRARDTRLDRVVALKVLPAELSDEPERIARFEREARMLASLNHPNVAGIHGLETSPEGRVVLVLEYVDGETLTQRLSSGALPYAESLDFCHQIAAGLEAAHAAGVVHRDLKPGNIMVTPRGQVKLLDFGLARQLQEEDAALAEEDGRPKDARTRTGVILGSPGYMSPEQVLGRVADSRADIWALGCILFECLSGLRAFDAGTGMAAYLAILQEPPDVERLPTDTPEDLRKLLFDCLGKEPQDRPAAVSQVRFRLEGLLRDVGGPATGLSRGDSRSATPFQSFAETQIQQVEAPNNLPEKLTKFIPREAELTQLTEELKDRRLVTLTGAGGCGKSRVALEAARQLLFTYPEGVWLVDLSSRTEGSGVAQSLADALGVHSSDETALPELLTDEIGERHILVIIDNCEHLIPATVELLQRLLPQCKGLRVLATSRASLGMAGELVHRVPSLALPPARAERDLAELATYESVALLVARAQLVKPGFQLDAQNAAAIVRICRRLDGIPLALELAAARFRMMSPDQVEVRLDDAFRLLKSSSKSGLPRQQTLKALIDWSYDQLSEPEQTLLGRLSVFAGDWTLQAVETIGAGGDVDEFDVLDLLEQLVEKSLVLVDEDEGGEPRYRLLQTMRQYCRSRLEESGDPGDVRRRHFRWFFDLATEAADHYFGDEQGVWLDRLEREHGNLSQALDWRVNEEDGGEDCLRLASALAPYWHRRSRYSLGLHYLQRALDHPDAQAPTEHRLRALNDLAYQATASGAFDIARRAVAEGYQIAGALGERKLLVTALHYRGVVASQTGNPVEAEEVYEESLGHLREIGPEHRLAACLHNLGNAKLDLQKYSEAEALYREALSLNRRRSNHLWQGYNLDGMADLAERQGDLEKARSLRTEALDIYRRIGESRMETECLFALAGLALCASDRDAATQLLDETLALAQRVDEHELAAQVERERARLALADDDLDQARRRLASAVQLHVAAAHEHAPASLLGCLRTAIAVAKQQGRERRVRRLQAAYTAVLDEVHAGHGPLSETASLIDRQELASGEWQPLEPDGSDTWDEGLALTSKTVLSYLLRFLVD